MTKNHTFSTPKHTRGAYNAEITTWLTVVQFIGFVPLSPLYSYLRESTTPSSRQLTLQLGGGAALAAARSCYASICISMAWQLGGAAAHRLHMRLGRLAALAAAQSCGRGYWRRLCSYCEPNPRSCCFRSPLKVVSVLAVSALPEASDF